MDQYLSEAAEHPAFLLILRFEDVNPTGPMSELASPARRD